MESSPSSATLRKFFFSYTLHLTSIIIFPLLVGLIILFLSYYYASHFFLKATLLELFGENAEIEYIFAIILGVVSLISVVFIISLLLSSFYYARNAFFTHANFFFSNSVYQNPFTKHGKNQTSSSPSYPIKPTSPPQSFNAQPTQNDALLQRYSDSSNRARWGPK